LNRGFRVLLIAAVAALAINMAPQTAGSAEASGCIRIYRIYYNSPGTDYGSNYSLNGEWIQLHNVCSYGKSLTGYKFRDAAWHWYQFGSYTLKAYGYVKIHTGSGTNTSTDRYQNRGSYVWNNNTDTAYLYNSAGTYLMKCYYNNSSVASHYC